jgi:hypothetical protein
MQNLERPRVAWFWWLVILAFPVVGLGCCTGLWQIGHQPRNGIRVEALEAEMRQQLPPGSTWEQARERFASRGLNVSEMEKDGRATGLAVMIPNNSFLDSAEIRVYLYFDGQRLQRITVERFVYSL